MVVVTVTDCPAKLRGDLSKWLLEISTGVYVGNLDARTRTNLWERIKSTLKAGRATMTYSFQGEQGLRFETYGNTWRQVDFDGLVLIERPSTATLAQSKEVALDVLLPDGFSKAAKLQMSQNRQRAETRSGSSKTIVVLDIETTGLNSQDDRIIEIGALKSDGENVLDSFQSLVHLEQPLPENISKLTGLTDEILKSQGVSIHDALMGLRQFLEGSSLVMHNAKFDLAFLQKELEACGLPKLTGKYEDTMQIAKKKRVKAKSFSLQDLAAVFGFHEQQTHRALEDCYLTLSVYLGLKKK